MDEVDQIQLRIRTTTTPSPPPPAPTPVEEEYMAARERKRSGKGAKKPQNTHCVFCKNNGETAAIYSSHILKDASGRVLCPILRAYTCPTCGTSGDNAHTMRYCPRGSDDAGSSLSLLRTPRLSTGKQNPRAHVLKRDNNLQFPGDLGQGFNF